MNVNQRKVMKLHMSDMSLLERCFYVVLLAVNWIIVAIGVIFSACIIILKYTTLINHNDFGDNTNLILKVIILDGIWFYLIAISAIMVFLGALGIYGLVKGSKGKSQLRTYLIMFIIIFITHNFFLNYSGYRANEVESSLKARMVTMANEAKSSEIEFEKFGDSCTTMRLVSTMFKCCEVKSGCCAIGTSGNCFDKVIKSFKERYEPVVLVTFVLISEFLIVLMTTFMLGSVRHKIKEAKEDKVENERYIMALESA